MDIESYIENTISFVEKKESTRLFDSWYPEKLSVDEAARLGSCDIQPTVFTTEADVEIYRRNRKAKEAWEKKHAEQLAKEVAFREGNKRAAEIRASERREALQARSEERASERTTDPNRVLHVVCYEGEE